MAILFPLVSWALLLKGRKYGAAAVSAALFIPAFLLAAAFAAPPLLEDPLHFLGQFRLFMGWQANILEGQETAGFRLLRNLLWLLRYTALSWLWVFLPGLVWSFRRLRRGGEGRRAPGRGRASARRGLPAAAGRARLRPRSRGPARRAHRIDGRGGFLHALDPGIGWSHSVGAGWEVRPGRRERMK